MKKVLVSGGKGKFAFALSKLTTTDYDFVFLSREELDVCDLAQLEKVLDETKPEIFIHAGALTRPMKKHYLQPDISISSNIIGTANVVLACMKRGIKVVYLSTDFVYPGTVGNYSENDALLPVNEYAWSKLGGECSVKLYSNSLILRMAITEIPFTHSHALIDVIKSPITQYDAAALCVKLLDQTGIINVGGPTCSIYDFAKNYNKEIKKITKELVQDTKMPDNTSMDISKLNEIMRNKK